MHNINVSSHERFHGVGRTKPGVDNPVRKFQTATRKDGPAKRTSSVENCNGTAERSRPVGRAGGGKKSPDGGDTTKTTTTTTGRTKKTTDSLTVKVSSGSRGRLLYINEPVSPLKVHCVWSDGRRSEPLNDRPRGILTSRCVIPGRRED